MTKKVSFNIASEASYVYILSGQMFIKNTKNWRFFEDLNLRSNSVTRQVNFKGLKMPKLKNSNETFSDNFQTLLGDMTGRKYAPTSTFRFIFLLILQVDHPSIMKGPIRLHPSNLRFATTKPQKF